MITRFHEMLGSVVITCMMIMLEQGNTNISFHVKHAQGGTQWDNPKAHHWETNFLTTVMPAPII